MTKACRVEPWRQTTSLMHLTCMNRIVRSLGNCRWELLAPLLGNKAEENVGSEERLVDDW